MSTTFWCPEAPTVTITPYPEDDPQYTEQESTLPVVSLSNSNAVVALEMLGQVSNDEQAGSLAVDELEPALRLLRSVLAHAVERAAFLEPCTVNGQCVSTQEQDGSFAASAPGSLEHLLRFKLASAVPPVPTLASQMYPLGGGVRFVNLGRSDGYVRSLAERLIGLLTQAKAQGFKVCWG